VRSQAAKALAELTALVSEILDRAKMLIDVLIPAYTHRQRAQPTSAAFLMCAWASQLLRAAEVIAFTLTQAQRSPLGSGACSGTSLPIDRQLTCELLGFAMPTTNALDTVGDRDFALDWSWSAARSLLALSRLATDIIDFSTSEFALVRLDGRIAAGSSMMPQKKNPDVFELVRGQSARAIGNVVGLLALVKGLPSGYNRDLQEDRRTLVETGSLLRGAIHALRLSLPHVHFDSVRGEAALMDGATQATDLAEVLVRRGVPFREAYKVIGALVAKSTERGTTLAKLLKNDPAVAQAAHPLLDEQALAVLDPRVAVRAKESLGGTGPRSVLAQIETLIASAEALSYVASTVPSLASLADGIASAPLKVSIPSGAPPRQ
jgi:argininosuccinate lyase